MRVEPYSDCYYLDVVKLVDNFYKEYLTDYYNQIKSGQLDKTIDRFRGENSKNAFLLIINGSCEGLLAGIELNSNLNSQRIFQEIIWYVNKPFGKYGIALVRSAEKHLKSFGFSIMIMSVLENCKTDKIKRIYNRIGYKPMESHYVRSL